MAKVFTVLNEKGGVGKTTTVIHLAHGMALLGYKTLIIDSDGQGNASLNLGLPRGDDLYTLILQAGARTLSDTVFKTGRANLDVLRSDPTTADLKVKLSRLNDDRQYVISTILENNTYDVVFIDCPPSVDVLMPASVVAADYLIIPTTCTQNSVIGMQDLMDQLNALKEFTTCEIAGILPTRVDLVKTEGLMQLKNIYDLYPQWLWSPIPQDANCEKLERIGMTFWEYMPKTRAMVGFDNGEKIKGGGYIHTLKHILRTYFGRDQF
ncbi:MAG: ParA family protein [Proteobacteria bacterium]|jgi:chromosome partitioning protein|nr:ParA family protein [Pseudomonadota bacterium]